ncbi:anti-anti-sigma factor [Chloroflexus islandicus]|uniref:Anti-anti-sigma factor n=1 Tax=Chloroflexus islandicus TaxID=1707952 RepID=A0A178MDC3_9CHLR|nr:STAS domain-containing protein [Chloroflexus islandicus]OAN46811.1 anti-anti-sigma factor [Chloroflexus islandicus]
MRSLLPWLMQIQHGNEDVVRRGRVIVVLALFANAMAIIAIPLVLFATPQTAFALIAVNLLGLVVYTAVIILARKGLVAVSGVAFVTTISLLTLMATFGFANDNATSYSSPFFLAFPIIIAGMVLKPALVWLVFLFNLAGLFIAWRLTGIPLFASPLEISLQSAAILLLFGTALFTFVGGSITARALRETRRLREEANRNAFRFTALNAGLEIEIAERTAALQTTLRDLEQRTAAQARLLAENEQQRQVIRELSVPVLPVRANTLVMPLIGPLDPARLADLQQQALGQLAQTGARDLLLDITGVPAIDPQVAQGLLQLVAAARLMGTRVTLAGVRPEVAQRLVSLGIDLQEVRTASTLQVALAQR